MPLSKPKNNIKLGSLTHTTLLFSCILCSRTIYKSFCSCCCRPRHGNQPFPDQRQSLSCRFVYFTNLCSSDHDLPNHLEMHSCFFLCLRVCAWLVWLCTHESPCTCTCCVFRSSLWYWLHEHACRFWECLFLLPSHQFQWNLPAAVPWSGSHPLCSTWSLSPSV